MSEKRTALLLRHNKRRMGVELPIPIVAQLQDAARRQDCSLRYLVQNILREWVEARHDVEPQPHSGMQQAQREALRNLPPLGGAS